MKIQTDKNMASVMIMVIMCHVDHLSAEMERENIQIVPKSTPRDINQVSPTI